MKKGFDSEPVYNGKYLRAKIRFYKEKDHPQFGRIWMYCQRKMMSELLMT